MSNQDLQEQMLILASKYLSGNASKAEISELEAWVMAKPENKDHFMAFKKAWMLAGMEKDSHKVDVDKLWEETALKTIDKKAGEETKVVPLRRNWMRIASSFALLIVAAFLLYQFLGQDSTMIVETKNESKSFELADGSQIVLNQSSSLEYKFDKKESRRVVVLSGDAFFDVARDEEHPFIIRTASIEVEVLGTSFYVDSRDDQAEVQVIVESGSVAVRSQSEEQVLAPNERAVFEKTSGKLLKEANNDENYRSLKTDVLDFRNSRLEDVVFALNRQFNADITINIEDTGNCKITTTFKNKPLDAVVKVIENTLGIEADVQGTRIVFSGAKCN